VIKMDLSAIKTIRANIKPDKDPAAKVEKINPYLPMAQVRLPEDCDRLSRVPATM
jgi:hypothetical protein